jgi:hypothetical protein
MPVADLAHEAARRYMDVIPIVDWVRGLLEQLGVPPAARTAAHTAELVDVWRRTLEPTLMEHFSIPKLHAMARFYATPEGASILRKDVAFRTAATPPLASELLRCTRAIAARGSAPTAAGDATS